MRSAVGRLRACAPHARPGRSALALAAALGLLGLLVLAGVPGSLAQWNDTAQVEGGAFATGSLDVTVDGGSGPVQALSPWTAFALSSVAPGEGRAKVLTLTNAGTTPFTLTASGSATGDASVLGTVDVRVVVGATTVPDTTYPRQEACIGGTQTFSGVLGAVGTAVLPAPAVGTVAPGASVSVCLQATLRLSAGNTTQGRTWTPTLLLTATQA